MVDYVKLLTPRKQPEPDPELEEEQESLQPQVDIVWNVYTEKGDAKSLALRISLRLPQLKS
jgi:hypothetical protein